MRIRPLRSRPVKSKFFTPPFGSLASPALPSFFGPFASSFGAGLAGSGFLPFGCAAAGSDHRTQERQDHGGHAPP